MTSRRSPPPFRDDLGAALERARSLARENAQLRARVAGRRFDWIQWTLVGVIAISGMTIAGIVLGR
jgi:hypothetical protein